MRKWYKRFPVMLGVVILVAACQSGTRLETLIYEDDFSNPASGWDRLRDGGINDYEAGMYRIYVDADEFFSWSLAQLNLGDVRIEVDTAYAGPAELGELGVICRWRDSKNYYILSIRTDGKYAVHKMVNGLQQFVGMDGYQNHAVINKGLETNHISATCQGNSLTLVVNGTELASVVDASGEAYTAGNVGLIAGTFSEPNVDALFDNFRVYGP